MPPGSLPVCNPSLEPADLPAGRVEGLYVHVPFCFHKCHYCDFYSITRQNTARMEAFAERILRETELWCDLVTGPTVSPRTIFFGGGTPSLLPPASMRRLVEGLRQRFDLTAVEEWTVEANPATVDADYCAMLRQAGVDRISFGAQSFDQRELATLERHHDPSDVARGLELARGAGFERLNIDLIYAIPGQDMESWRRSLETAIAFGTSHLSCYGLTYEPNTPMAVKKRLGLLNAAAEETELAMFRHTRRRLADAGLPPYEISNYAAPGQECRHNLMYWSGGNYVALGPSGASHVDGWRWRNRPHLGEWEEAIDASRLPVDQLETLTPRQRAGELAMLCLRLTRGLNFDEFAARVGSDARALFAEQIERLGRLGLLLPGDSGLRVSEAGWAVADALAAEFLAPG